MNRIKDVPRRKKRKGKPPTSNGVNGHAGKAPRVEPPCVEPPDSPKEAVGDGLEPHEKVFWEAAVDTLASLNHPGPGVETVPPQVGKDAATGRFTAGNRFGRGNPHARRQAEFHKALMDAVTPHGLQSLAVSLWTAAKGGDVQAAGLLLSYLIGKPRTAPDPDALDLDEFRLAAASPTLAEVARAFSDSVDPAAAAAAVRWIAERAAGKSSLKDGISAEELNGVIAVTEKMGELMEDAEDGLDDGLLGAQLSELRKTRCKKSAK